MQLNSPVLMDPISSENKSYEFIFSFVFFSQNFGVAVEVYEHFSKESRVEFLHVAQLKKKKNERRHLKKKKKLFSNKFG